MSLLQGNATHLAWTDVFSAAQAEDLVEGKSKSCSTEACCSAVVDGPHECQRPGAHQLHEEDPGDQRQTVRQAALWALGVFQKSSNQESLCTRWERAWRKHERKHNEVEKKQEHGGDQMEHMSGEAGRESRRWKEKGYDLLNTTDWDKHVRKHHRDKQRRKQGIFRRKGLPWNRKKDCLDNA